MCKPLNLRRPRIKTLQRDPYTVISFTFEGYIGVGFSKARPGPKGNEFDPAAGYAFAFRRAFDDWSDQRYGRLPA